MSTQPVVTSRPSASIVRLPGPALPPTWAILPPSMAMIVYATLAGSTVSISGLFASGFVPGITIGILTMVLISILARAWNLPVTGETL